MKGLRVLIIEDMESVRKFMRFCVDRSFPNIAIDEAAKGKEAKARLENTEYDLVLCDWGLPDISGEEILLWMKDHPRLNAVPFIMVTSRSDKESVLKAVNSGVSSYVVKPFTAESLAQKISAVADKFDRREFERMETDGICSMHFNNLLAVGKLIDISLGGVFGIFSRKEPLPGILENVLVDIRIEGNPDVSGIGGFVIRIQAAEALADAENIKFGVKFGELVPEKRGAMEKILGKLKSQRRQSG